MLPSIVIAANNIHNADGMKSSAESTLATARECQAEGNANAAKMWALRSLAYSVGVFSPAYAEAQAS